MQDYHILAQALLGSGKVQKSLTATMASSGGGAGRGASVGKRWSISRSSTGKHDTAATAMTPHQDPHSYFQEALKVIDEGIAVGKVEDEIEDAMEEMGLLAGDVRRQLTFLRV